VQTWGGPGQVLAGAAQPHVPALHVNPTPFSTVQENPQLPQFAVLVAVSTQDVPAAGFAGLIGQRVTVAGDALQTQPGAPPTDPQVPSPQACPQVPQLFESLARSTQAVPQVVSPVGHTQAPFTQDSLA